MTKKQLYERLAAIEHERWADWQRWVHSKTEPGVDAEKNRGRLISQFDYERWERQIATPYEKLSEPEKQADRDQVDRYWRLIEDHLQ